MWDGPCVPQAAAKSEPALAAWGVGVLGQPWSQLTRRESGRCIREHVQKHVDPSPPRATKDLRIYLCTNHFPKWSQAESNRRPPACKAGALPTELWPLEVLEVVCRTQLPYPRAKPRAAASVRQRSYAKDDPGRPLGLFRGVCVHGGVTMMAMRVSQPILTPRSLALSANVHETRNP